MSAPVCDVCGERARWSAEVLLVIVFAPGLKKPYPLIAAEGYRYCEACDAVLSMVCKAVDAHPVTRAAGDWTRAIVVHVDGEGTNVKRSGTQRLALA